MSIYYHAIIVIKESIKFFSIYAEIPVCFIMHLYVLHKSFAFQANAVTQKSWLPLLNF